MDGFLTAPRTEFLVLNLALYHLLIFTRVIIASLTDGTLEAN